MTTTLEKSQGDFILFEREDEKQIVNLNDFANDKKLVYEVRGNYELSYLAIKHLSLIMAKEGHPLETVYSQVIIGEDQNNRKWYATVRVKNMNTGQVTEGVSEADYYTEKKEYDPFGRTKAHSKAERNAIRKQLPERLITKAIENAKARGDVKNISSQKATSDSQTIADQIYCGCPLGNFDLKGTCSKCGKLDRKFVASQKEKLGKA